MSNLPIKPDISSSANAWPKPGDERRPSGPGRASPERHPHPWDDRDARDTRDRGNRSRYVHSGPRSPHPSRSTDTYIAGSRDAYHTREYRTYDDGRAWEDRRRDRERDRERDTDRDRDRGYYRRQRVDDTWTPRRDYSPSRPIASRRGYDLREGEWRGRDDYRRGRERERGRSWDRDRDREQDRRPPSPIYRPAPLSPRRDYHREHHSPPRRARPPYSSRGRRSASPGSVRSRSRRSSPLSRTRPESVYLNPTRDISRPPSPRRASPSPNRPSGHGSTPTRARQSAERTGYQFQSASDTYGKPSGPEPAPGAEQSIQGTAVLDGEMDVKGITVTLIKTKDRFDNQDREPHGRGESLVPPGSPIGCQQQSVPSAETDGKPSSEAVVTQPYLPAIPRHEAKSRFSAAYESEYNRLEAHRSHAAAECQRCLKASRRAFHELDMTTLDLRAAQHRRELAEAHRKKAHHGQLGIDAESV